MINKKIIFKIFIIFFIAISTILICNTSKATLRVSRTGVTVYVGQTATLMITSEGSSGGVGWSQYLPNYEREGVDYNR